MALQKRGDDQGITVLPEPRDDLDAAKETGIFHVKWFHAERLHNHLRNIPPEEYRADYFAKSGVPALNDDGNITADHSQHVSLFTICEVDPIPWTA
jgi:hypothetical protein